MATGIAGGGRADKLGNRYEMLWVSHNLVRLLAEELRAVQLEAVGDDEPGVDLWVTDLGGVHHAHQCKRKNRTVDRWTVAELAGKEVLSSLAGQLRRNPEATFTLVSSHPASELRELADFARSVGGDPDVFFREVAAVSAHARPLAGLCQALGVDSQTPEGRGEAFNLLGRTRVHVFDDSQEGRGLVFSLVRCRVQGDPQTVVSVLADFAVERMGEVITANMVRAHLRERGFALTSLAGDAGVSDRLELLDREFRKSLRPGLIHSSLVPRAETDRILDCCKAEGGNRLVIVHGKAGYGKSCVLLELVDRLEAEGVPCLPLRLDRRTPRVSAKAFGEEVCELPESPAVVLHSFHAGRRAVLVLDQLDAVRWTPAHGVASWEACCETIDEALGFGNLTVVVACRTFDLSNDHQISTWRTAQKAVEVEVGDLPETAVTEAVGRAGGVYDRMTPKQKDLLQPPLHLSLWAVAQSSGSIRPEWGSRADLMDAFWESRHKELARHGAQSSEVRAAISAITDAMDAAGEIAAPARILNGFPSAAGPLKTLHIVVESNRRISFAHQSYLEYLLATHLIEQARAGGRTIYDWVRGGGQTLVRRDQLRLVLTLFRDDQPGECERTIRRLVTAPDGEVRFHLRQLALRVLGDAADPTPGEVALAVELAGAPEWRPHLIDQVLVHSPRWFEAVVGAGVLRAWLDSNDNEIVGEALQLCRRWAADCGNLVAGLLRPLADRADPHPRMAANVLALCEVANDSEELLALRLRLVRAGIGSPRFLLSQQLAERSPGRCVEAIDALLDYRANVPDAAESLPRDERDVPFWLNHHEAEHVKRAFASEPQLAWARLAPRVVAACEASRRDDAAGEFWEDETWPPADRRYRYDHRSSLPEVVAGAGSVLYRVDAAGFLRQYDAIVNHASLTVQVMVGLVLATAEGDADASVGWLCDNPSRLALEDERGGRWTLAGRIIRAHAPRCSQAAYARLEAAILARHEPDERRSAEWKLVCARNGWPLGPNRVGYAQHALLPCLPPDRLSADARSMMGVLERKYPRPAEAETRGRPGSIRQLTATIPADRLAGIDDEGWLGIIAYAARPERGRYRDVGESSFVELTPEAYARGLGDQARQEPGRFARLALRIPATAPPAYLAAILYAVAQLVPPTSDAVDWVTASDAEVLALIERAGYDPDREVGHAACRLMEHRRRALSTPASLELLARYATDHPHPASDDPVLVRRNRGEEQEDYDTAAINCVRGIVVEVVGQLLLGEPCLLETFRTTLGRAAADPSPVVRVAAARALLAVLNSERDLAVELFLAATGGAPDGMLSANSVLRFIQHAQCSHSAQLSPLLARMASSAIPAVAEAGATWATVAWLAGWSPRESIDGLLRGNPTQRAGVARAAAHNCGEQGIADRCFELLLELADDPDDGVQQAVAEFARDSNVLRHPLAQQVAARFAAGPGFAAHPDWLADALRGYPDSLVPLEAVVRVIWERLSSDLASTTRTLSGRASYTLDRLVTLVLRLYEQAEGARNVELRGRCLDWWDALLRARIVGATALLVRLDEGM